MFARVRHVLRAIQFRSFLHRRVHCNRNGYKVKGMYAANDEYSRSSTKEHIMADKFMVLGDEKVYSRYLTLFNRKVQYPDGQIHEFDVCGHAKTNFQFAVVVPFNTKTQRFTVVHEFAQGSGHFMYCFPSGGLDLAKHDSMEECAKAELREEGELIGGEFVRLMDGAIPETKWCLNSFVPYLCIDPEHDAGGANRRDVEEAGMSVHEFTLSEIKDEIAAGRLQAPSIIALHMGLEVLRTRSLLN